MSGLSMETVMPEWVIIVLAAGVGIGIASLGLILAAQAAEKILRLIRRTLAANLRLQHLRMQTDNAALNYWIRDSFHHKRIAEQERRRADQERYDRRQIAMGADNYMRSVR